MSVSVREVIAEPHNKGNIRNLRKLCQQFGLKEDRLPYAVRSGITFYLLYSSRTSRQPNLAKRTRYHSWDFAKIKDDRKVDFYLFEGAERYFLVRESDYRKKPLIMKGIMTDAVDKIQHGKPNRSEKAQLLAEHEVTSDSLRQWVESLAAHDDIPPIRYIKIPRSP